jgi:hypothetical protein
VPDGTGITNFASNALKDGISILTEPVSPSPTIVLPTAVKELVNPATMVTPSSMDSVWPQSPLSQLIPDVELGIGTTKDVFNALKDGYSVVIMSVRLLITNAKLMMLMETVLPATMDTMLLEDNVLWHQLLAQLKSDVPLGIGINKFAFNALMDGFSTIMESAKL